MKFDIREVIIVFIRLVNCRKLQFFVQEARDEAMPRETLGHIRKARKENAYWEPAELKQEPKVLPRTWNKVRPRYKDDISDEI